MEIILYWIFLIVIYLFIKFHWRRNHFDCKWQILFTWSNHWTHLFGIYTWTRTKIARFLPCVKKIILLQFFDLKPFLIIIAIFIIFIIIIIGVTFNFFFIFVIILIFNDNRLLWHIHLSNKVFFVRKIVILRYVLLVLFKMLCKEILIIVIGLSLLVDLIRDFSKDLM